MNVPEYILILGGGGIGLAIAQNLVHENSGSKCILTYRTQRPKVDEANILLYQFNPLEEQAYSELSAFIDQNFARIDWLINAIGMLHQDIGSVGGIKPEKRLQDFNTEHFQQVMSVNTLPTVFAAKHLAKHFQKKQPAVFATVSAKVGSISDNRLGGWHSYRASKAALNMMLKNIAIEWAYKLPDVCVLALHPGTTDSKLSEPFQKNVPEGKLFSPEQCAHYLVNVILTKTGDESGSFYAWNNEKLPW